MTPKKILITGGAGFIGSRLASALLDRGFEVLILDNLSPQIHGINPEQDSPLYQSVLGKTPFLLGSVTNKDDWRTALSGVDTVVHLAAETGTGQSMYQISRYVDVNVGGTALLLDILANEKHSVSKVVVASSRAIYGEGKYLTSTGLPVYPGSRNSTEMSNGQFEVTIPGETKPLTLVATDEHSQIHPTSVYGITKYNQEQLVLNVCQAIGIESVALRFQNVYGPGQSLNNPYTGILAIFSNLIQNGMGINIFEDGKESRDFVYIDDVVQSLMLSISASGLTERVFNIGTGVPTSVFEVATRLCECYERQVSIQVTGNYRIGDIRHNFADISRARAVLGFEPQVSFADGLRQFADWVKLQKVVKPQYESSLLELKEKGLMKSAN